MISTVRYRVTRLSWDDVYGVAVDGGEERLLGRVRESLPDCSRGDVLEIDYDDSIDERGEMVAARVVDSARVFSGSPT